MLQMSHYRRAKNGCETGLSFFSFYARIKQPEHEIEYRYAPHNDVSVNDGPHVRQHSNMLYRFVA
jgi:hypothetical protein